MKRYSEYKDSGVKWIGEIPEHWKIMRLRAYLSMYSEKNHPDKQLLSVTRESGVIVRNTESKEENHNYIPDDLSGYKLVRIGDFAINKMKSWQGSYGVSNFEGIVSPAYYVCKLKFPYKDFFSNAIRCKAYIPFFTQYSKGIRVDQWDLSPIALKNIPFFEPPLPEQQAIVTYLDTKVAKIDEYISIAEKKISALEELKQTIIAEAVTRGIHKEVPMKDSGVKWVGMIPEHWDLLRAKNIFERQFRPVRDCDEVVTCFRDGQVTLRKNRRIEGFTESLKEIGYQGIRKGDLVIHQMDAFAGSIGVSDSDGKGTPVYVCCLPKDSKNVNVYFYAYLLREMARSGFIKSLYRGIRERSSDFRFDTFAVQWLPLVPIEEQQEIVTYIEAKVAKIDQLCQAERSQIEKLKEYKQRLISDVVTGKVKVTND